MKKIITTLCLTLLFVSCSNNENVEVITEPKSSDYEYSIEALSSDIQLFDTVTFRIISNSQDGLGLINDVEWNFGNGIENDSYREIEKQFNEFGSFTVNARIYFSDGTNITKSLNFIVNDREHFIVKIVALEITGIANNQYQYFVYNQFNATSLAAHFSVTQGEQITFISEVDNTNNTSMSYNPIIWDLSANNVTTKVYKEGDIYPFNGYNHFEFEFYGQNTRLSNPVRAIASDNVSLNEYRVAQPTSLTLNDSFNDITYKITLQWN